MAQRDFVAAQLTGGVVECAPAHARAGVAGLAVQAPHNLKDVGGYDLKRYSEELGVVGDGLAGVVGVAGVHGEERDLEVATAVAIELLEELGEQKRVLAARDAYGDMVAVANELVVGQRLDERHPQLFAVACDDVALDLCAVGTFCGVCAGGTVYVVYLPRCWGLFARLVHLAHVFQESGVQRPDDGNGFWIHGDTLLSSSKSAARIRTSAGLAAQYPKREYSKHPERL